MNATQVIPFNFFYSKTAVPSLPCFPAASADLLAWPPTLPNPRSPSWPRWRYSWRMPIKGKALGEN
jgi:hypothetical protein